MRIFSRVTTFQGTVHIKKQIFRLVLISLLFKLVGCKEDPSFLGRDIMPDSDIMVVKMDSSIDISAYTITGKSITTSLNNYFPLGSLMDSIFGFTTAGIVSQYQPALLQAPGTISSIDSIQITLLVAKAYGDSAAPQIIRVHELTEEIRLDTIYFSDFDINGKYDPNELGVGVFMPRDSVINIKLTNQDYFNKFFVQPDSVYKTIENFVKVFKGYYFKTDPVTDGGGYAYIDLSSLQTYIRVYHSGGSSFIMNFSSNVSRFNIYDHDYASYPIHNHIDLPGSNDSLLFIEGLSGTSVRLNFLGIDTFLNDDEIAINKASLIIPVDTTLGNYKIADYPLKLMLFKLEDDGDYDYLYDYKISSTYFNGTYSKKEKAYIINLGLHLQSIIDGKIENSNLVLVSFTSNEAPNRVILRGTGSSRPKIILKVTYTDI